MTDPAPQEHPQEVNLRVARPLLAYLADTQGEEIRDEVLTAAGVTVAEFELEDHWIAQADLEELLAAARRRLKSDDEFRRAAQYQIAKQFGPLTLVLRFTSMNRIVETLDRTRHLVTRIARFESEPLPGPNGVRIRYRSERPESRLLCLYRRSQWEAIPAALWGLPPAVIRERKCIADGDDCCECDLRWEEPFRWRGPLVGFAAGAALGVVLWLTTGVSWLAPWPALLGAMLGLQWGTRRVLRAKESFQLAKSQEAEIFVSRHLEATQELLRLHNRKERWTALVERQSLQSSHTLGAVLSRIQTLTAEDPEVVRGISHDLRNPLTLVRMSADLLANAIEKDADRELLERYATHLKTGVDRLNEMLDDVMRLANTHASPGNEEASIKDIATAPLVERYRRQLLALTVDRELEISVELGRETPARLETRPSVLERVMDNLLTNAAKYTAQGRIHVEISGVPGFLVLKVADTGRGIHEDRLEAVLTGETIDDAPLVGDSRGLGLSVVVRLLDRLGGRLEVLSRPDMGTTFWVYVPTQPLERLRPTVDEEPIEHVIRRVVTIRGDSAELPELFH